VSDPSVSDAVERWVQDARDGELFRLDVLAWAAARGLDEDRAIDAFVHASNLGLVEMSWDLLCPGCGGVLGANAALRTIRESYECRLCAGAYQPKLDEMVEVSFTVSPGVRRIAHHTPDSLPMWEYLRRMYFGNGLLIPDDETWNEEHKKYVIEAEEVPPRERVVLAVTIPSTFTIAFDAVTHATSFIDVQGETTSTRQDLTLVFDASGVSPSRVTLRPGPCRVAIENRTERRLLPALFAANDDFHRLFDRRLSFLTARRMFTNQTFRDVYRAGTLDIDQRLKLTSLTVLFTDLKGSTALYERVGDLAAYDIVRAHFGKMAEVVRGHSGAVVKTIGDAVMATFDTPDDGLAAALDMRHAMDRAGGHVDESDLQIKIGLHEGPCLAVTSNDRLDYFGQTVNIAARVQGLAEGRAIYVTEPVVRHSAAAELLSRQGLMASPKRALLKGIKDELTVYEIE